MTHIVCRVPSAFACDWTVIRSQQYGISLSILTIQGYIFLHDQKIYLMPCLRKSAKTSMKINIWNTKNNNERVDFKGSSGIVSKTTHRLEPPQNPNKSAKKMFFFHGDFYMVETEIEKLFIWCLYFRRVYCLLFWPFRDRYIVTYIYTIY